MKQFGDITKLHGDVLEAVDLIVGGSPCQDLSISGKRAGLEGERSGLFMEMIRIIKEMRKKTNGIYPRYALWENVPGAFSSNGGEDFAAVLTEFIRIAEPTAPDVHVPKKKWTKSGIVLGDFWSIAWRTHDTQYWGKTIRDCDTGDVLQVGTPQRRRRIALVADFRGRTAPEILFERKGVSGDIESSGETGKTVTGSSEKSIDKAGTTIYGESVTPTLIARLETAVGNTQDGLIVYQPSERERERGRERERERENSVNSFQERSGKPGGGKGILIQKDRTGALSTVNNQMVYRISSYDSNAMKSPNPFSGIYQTDKSNTLDLNGGNPACNQGGIMILNKGKCTHEKSNNKESETNGHGLQ